MIKSRVFVVCLGLATIPGATGAALMNGASFTPSAPAITFATPGDGGFLEDPSYALSTPGGLVTVSFGLYFEGQTVQTDFPFSLATQQPTGPLTLAHNPLAGAVEITGDLSPGATNPVLAGQPSFLVRLRFISASRCCRSGFGSGSWTLSAPSRSRPMTPPAFPSVA